MYFNIILFFKFFHSAGICFSLFAEYWPEHEHGYILWTRHCLFLVAGYLGWTLAEVSGLLLVAFTLGHLFLFPGAGECSVVGHKE